MQQRIGIKTELVSPEDLTRLLPGASTDDVGGAAWEPESGFADPNATAFAFAAAAIRGGARIETARDVTRVVVERGRVVGVETREGRVAAPVVVLVPGAWAGRLLEPLGLDFGLVPYRIQVSIFRWPAGLTRRDPAVIDAVHESWTRPEGGAATLIGVEPGAGPAHPHHYSEAVDPEDRAPCRAKLSPPVPPFPRP